MRVAILLVLAAAPALTQTAQVGEPTVDSKPTAQQIQVWLSSQDPRLIAWGAYFAGQNLDAPALDIMLTRLDQWQPAASQRSDAASSPRASADERIADPAQYAQDYDQSDAMAEILDALIQNNVALNLPQLTVIRHSFPDQTLILAKRLPPAQASRLLLTMYMQRDQPQHGSSARVAAMMLAKAPPPGFAASILAETEERLTIHVITPGQENGFGLMCGGVCGEGTRERHKAGWPPLFTYRLTENRREDGDTILVEAGSDAVFIHRMRDTRISGSCSAPRSLDGSRQGIIAEMLGLPPTRWTGASLRTNPSRGRAAATSCEV